MRWFIDLLSSSLGKKILMALTGIFLIAFLIVHLAGNLQLLKGDEGRSFNTYAEFMSVNPLIQFVSKINFALIVVHVVWGVMLTLKNRSSRGTQGYSKVNNSSHWTSRNMGILGTLILLFIVIHLRHFYAEVHWGAVPTVQYDDTEVRDLYSLVSYWFAKGWYVALYVFCMGALAFHLWHGFTSVFQTLGMNHIKYNGLIDMVGKTFSIVVPALYALIPIVMFLE